VAKAPKALTPARYLAAGIAKFSPAVRATANGAIARVRALLPGATEFVYDNYNAFAIGFGPNDRPSDALFSVVLYPRQVNLGFIQGAVLDDPDRVLQGTGTQFRHIKLIPDASVLDQPQVRTLMEQAVRTSDVQPDPHRRRVVMVRAVSRRQRPRRPR
jgi:hypothetical protein